MLTGRVVAVFLRRQPTEAEACGSGATAAEVMTLAMTRCGTPFWTAPEIVQGATYNEKVDQYAYGMLLLEILTGRPPWHSEAPKGQQLAPLKVSTHSTHIETLGAAVVTRLVCLTSDRMGGCCRCA